MKNNNKPHSISLDAIKLASKSLDLYKAMKSRGLKRINLEISNDPNTVLAGNIVKKMVGETFRIMDKAPLKVKQVEIRKAMQTIEMGYDQGVVSANDYISATLQFEMIKKVGFGKN